MGGSTHSGQVIRSGMNGSGRRGTRCCDSGITRYSIAWKAFWRPSETLFLPLTQTLSPKGRGEIIFCKAGVNQKEDGHAQGEKYLHIWVGTSSREIGGPARDHGTPLPARSQTGLLPPPRP